MKRKTVLILLALSLILASCALHPDQVQINGFDGVYVMTFEDEVKAALDLDWGLYIVDDWRGCGCYELSDTPHALDTRFGTANFVSEECPRLVTR